MTTASRRSPWVGRALAAPVTLLAAGTSSSDIAAAQTAASIENLAITAYGDVARLSAVQSLPSPARLTIATFLAGAAQHHADHLTAFNAAATRLGAKVQTATDTALASSVLQPALASASTAAQLLGVLAQLELIAAETYAAQVVVVTDRQLRNSLATITGVEGQHSAVLLAAASLIDDAMPDLLPFPWAAAGLPETVATAGIPSAFLRSDQARSPTEGAVR